mgnify:CR=1 FL=1
MKNLLILTFCFCLTLSINSQSIYKGLKYGMTQAEAKKEFKKNKKDYTTVDLGNNLLYRIYRQNFVFINNKLVAVPLTPKGFAFGMQYDDAKNYLTATRSFFEKLGYEAFIDNKWWDAPLNFANSNSKWGLILNKKDKSTIVQMYPVKYNVSSSTSFIVHLKVWHYDTWMNSYNNSKKQQKKITEKSGF